MRKALYAIAIMMMATMAVSCGDDDIPKKENPFKHENGNEKEPEKEQETEKEPVIVPDGALTVSLDGEHQTMVGFGGALCWLTHFLQGNEKKEEVYDLLFDDLGMDLIRVGMWYYPRNYPTQTEPKSDDDDNYLLNITKDLVAKAKEYNPDVQILMSCWGPPAQLKSNGQREGGMLKFGENSVYDKNDKDRMRAERTVAYSNYAQFFQDAFEHIGFVPDYLSIQNECSYKADWVSCKWSYNDTHSEPNYYSAFDSVYNRLYPIYGAQMPKMLACEAENLDVLEKFYPWKKITGDNFHKCWGYNYHLYNFDSYTDMSYIKERMQTLGTEMTDRPNMMTEYDGMQWFRTARMIQYNLIYANASSYLYWNMWWHDGLYTNEEGEQTAMIAYTGGNDKTYTASGYRVGPFYYLIKHFSKHIDRGYKRVDIADNKESGFESSAFVSPDGESVTIVVVNPTNKSLNYNVEVDGKTVKEISAYQSKNSDRKNCYKTLEKLSPEKPVVLPAESITTIVLKIQ